MCYGGFKNHSSGASIAGKGTGIHFICAVLVNPRPNNEEYTKYSFPSKDIEYLSSGKPTVAFLLDGMPKCYQDFLYVVDPNRDISCAISDALKAAISAPKKEIEKKAYAISAICRKKSFGICHCRKNNQNKL